MWCNCGIFCEEIDKEDCEVCEMFDCREHPYHVDLAHKEEEKKEEKEKMGFDPLVDLHTRDSDGSNINTLWCKCGIFCEDIDKEDCEVCEMFDCREHPYHVDLAHKEEEKEEKKEEREKMDFDPLVDLHARDSDGYVFFDYQGSNNYTPDEKRDIRKNISYLLKKKCSFDIRDAEECRREFEEMVGYRQDYRHYFGIISEDGSIYMRYARNRDRIHNENYWNEQRKQVIHCLKMQCLKKEYIFTLLFLDRKYSGDSLSTLNDFFKEETNKFDKLYENLYRESKRKGITIPLRIIDFYEVDGEFHLLGVFVFFGRKKDLKRMRSIPNDCEVAEFNMKDSNITTNVIVNKLLSGWFYKKISWTTAFFYWWSRKVPVRCSSEMRIFERKDTHKKGDWKSIGFFNQESLADYLYLTYDIDPSFAKRAWHYSLIKLTPELKVRWRMDLF